MCGPSSDLENLQCVLSSHVTVDSVSFDTLMCSTVLEAWVVNWLELAQPGSFTAPIVELIRNTVQACWGFILSQTKISSETVALSYLKCAWELLFGPDKQIEDTKRQTQIIYDNLKGHKTHKKPTPHLSTL